MAAVLVALVGARAWLGPLVKMRALCPLCGGEQTFWCFEQCPSLKNVQFRKRAPYAGDAKCKHNYSEPQSWEEVYWLW